jgi:surface protein
MLADAAGCNLFVLKQKRTRRLRIWANKLHSDKTMSLLALAAAVLSPGTSHTFNNGCTGSCHGGLTTPLDDTNIHAMIQNAQKWCSSTTYCEIDNWDVSRVTHMYRLFENDAANNIYFTSFNQDIDSWDVSGVTTFSQVFWDAPNFNNELNSWNTAQATLLSVFDVSATTGSTFNRDIGSWNTARVRYMIDGFKNARLFNQDIGSWCTNHVNSIIATFSGAQSFNQDINSWATFHVNSFEGTFFRAYSFNQPLDNWPATNVVSLRNTFYDSAFNQNIDSWHTGQVTTLSNTFTGSLFNQELGTWDVDHVSDMISTFQQASLFDQDLNSWNTGAVTSFESTFYFAISFNGDLSKWDTSEATTLKSTFEGAGRFASNLAEWDVSQVTTLESTFSSSHTHASTQSSSIDLSKWDTSNVVSFEETFYDTSAGQYGNLNGWDVSQVTTMKRFLAERKEGLDSPLGNWDVANVQDFTEFGTVDSFYSFVGGDPTITMDLTAWTKDPSVTFDYGSCKQYFPPPVNLIGEACGTTSTTTTETSSTITTTTVADCDAGKYLDTSANQCVNCPSGQYRIGTTGHAHEVLTSCRPHSACGPGESTLFAGTADMDAQCIAPSATTHCGTDEFVDGAISIYNGQWHLQCVAHTAVGSFNSSLCPWAGSSHANASNTLLNVTISDPTSSHDPVADLTDDHKTFFNSFDELTRAENNKGHVWVRLCTPKINCLASNNEYVYSDGSETSNRVCRVCPRICGGVEYMQPASCPVQTLNPELPRAECTVAIGDNSAVCCRIAYDRSAYQQDIGDGDCESNPFGETDATQVNLNHQCNGDVATRSTISTTTTTVSTVTETTTTITSTTTTFRTCPAGQFRDPAYNDCAFCPVGQFQPDDLFSGSSCRTRSTCDPDTEVELTAVDIDDARVHDTLCGTLQECVNGQYRVNYNNSHLQSGSWKLDCRAFEAVNGVNACDSHDASEVSITITPDLTTGDLVVEQDSTALRNLPLIHICSAWTDCLASENKFVASEGSTVANRECGECPYLESGEDVAVDYPGWDEHSCNTRQSAEGDYTTAAGYYGECTGVTSDNADYCCRRGFDRSTLHFRVTSAADCRDHAPDAESPYGWLADTILVLNPTTTTATTVTESKLTTTSTTPPETIDVSGDTVKVVAAGTNTKEEEIAGFVALGVGVAVVLGVCAFGLYQASKSSFSDAALFEKEKSNLLSYHVE